MPAQPFDVRAFVASQVAFLIQCELTTLPQARAAIESLAADPAYWSFITPFLQQVDAAAPALVTQAEQAVAADQQRRKHGVS